MTSVQNDIRVIFHNIRSAHNVGAMFRTADAIGVTCVYITGYTPTPTDKFGRIVKEIAKTALGAERHIPWEYHKTPTALLQRLKKEHVMIAGIEQDNRAIDYKHFHPNGPIAFLMGNEVRGISPQMKRACDVLLEIPMHGKKESLNVATSFGIVLFRVCDRL